MSDDRRQFDVLTRHFIGGFLDNDLISPASDLHGLLSKVAAVLAMYGVMYPFKLLFTYGRPFHEYRELDLLSWGDKSGFVTLSLVVMGLLTVLEWDALQLNRRDCLALGALPIRPPLTAGPPSDTLRTAGSPPGRPPGPRCTARAGSRPRPPRPRCWPARGIPRTSRRTSGKSPHSRLA